MYKEDDLIALSALQHFVFCPRQCALIHVEQTWIENRLTAEGRILHETADSGLGESRGDLRIARGLPLRSLRLGLSGRADVVEFHRVPDDHTGIVLVGVEGRWQPFPVEYKRGKPKEDDCDLVQLCAQALCLEEMLGAEIRAGALFYGETRHRLDVEFTTILRERTERSARGVHDQLASGQTPKAEWAPKVSTLLFATGLPASCSRDLGGRISDCGIGRAFSG